MNVFELFAKLGIDTKDFDKGLSDAEKSSSNFGNKLKTGIGVAAGITTAAIGATTAAVAGGAKVFMNGVSSVAQYGDNIDKMSQKLGISAKAYQEWDAVMQHSGSSIDSLKPAMKTLASQAQNNASEFQKLGISEEEVKNLSQEDLFGKVIEGLQNMEQGTEKTALTSKLLGKSAMDLGALLNSSAEETKAMKDRVHELGGVMSDEAVKNSAKFQDELQDMNTALSGVKRNMLSDFLPSFSTVMNGLSSIFSGNNSEEGMKKIERGISSLADNLMKKAPTVFAIGGKIINSIVSSITTNLPTLLTAAVPIIMELATGIIQNAPLILSSVISVISTIASSIANPENLKDIMSSAVEIILVLSDAISKNAPTVIPAIVDVIMQMLTALTDESVLMPLLQAGLSVITSIVQGILKAIPVLIKNLPAIITNIVNFLVNSTPLIIQAAIQLFLGIVKAIPQIIVELAKALPQIIKTIVDGLGAGLSQIVKVGGDLIRGLWKGISDMGKWIGEKIKGFGQGVVNSLKSFFGIHSPSRVFAEIGNFLAEGLGEGFEDGIDDTLATVTSNAEKVIDGVRDVMDGSLSDVDLSARQNITSVNSISSANDGSTASVLESIGAYIDAKLSNLEITVPVYIGGKKIDQQIVMASARNAVVSGGR